MSFLCTTINKEVDYEKCQKQCQYIFKSACIDRMNEAYNQALEDFADLISKNSHIDFDECYVDGGGTVITTKEVFDLAEQLKR